MSSKSRYFLVFSSCSALWPTSFDSRSDRPSRSTWTFTWESHPGKKASWPVGDSLSLLTWLKCLKHRGKAPPPWSCTSFKHLRKFLAGPSSVVSRIEAFPWFLQFPFLCAQRRTSLPLHPYLHVHSKFWNPSNPCFNTSPKPRADPSILWKLNLFWKLSLSHIEARLSPHQELCMRRKTFGSKQDRTSSWAWGVVV